jgi:hypothetical protein
MQPLFCSFWKDDRGTALISDWILLSSILVIAVLPCMMGARERVRQILVPKEPRAFSVNFHSTGTMAGLRNNGVKGD